MEVVVDLATRSLSLADPEDTERFSLRVPGAPPPPAGDAASAAAAAALATVLEDNGAGRLSAVEDAFISPDAITWLAAGRVGPGLDERFTAMCAYATAKGWADPDDGAIRAHVVWGPTGA